jgi:hypothetical protein
MNTPSPSPVPVPTTPATAAPATPAFGGFSTGAVIVGALLAVTAWRFLSARKEERETDEQLAALERASDSYEG